MSSAGAWDQRGDRLRILTAATAALKTSSPSLFSDDLDLVFLEIARDILEHLQDLTGEWVEDSSGLVHLGKRPHTITITRDGAGLRVEFNDARGTSVNGSRDNVRGTLAFSFSALSQQQNTLWMPTGLSGTLKVFFSTWLPGGLDACGAEVGVHLVPSDDYMELRGSAVYSSLRGGIVFASGDTQDNSVSCWAMAQHPATTSVLLRRR